jgi:hypothetical protein
MNDHIDPKVITAMQPDNATQECHPNESKSGHFFREVDTCVEADPQYNIAEDHDQHNHQADDHDDLERPEERVYRQL